MNPYRSTFIFTKVFFRYPCIIKCIIWYITRILITGLSNPLALVNPLKCFFSSEGHVALVRNPGSYTLLLQLIPGNLLSACPHRLFHTLPSLLDRWAALPNSNPYALLAIQGGSSYHFYDGLWYDPAGMRTHDLPYQRQTR